MSTGMSSRPDYSENLREILRLAAAGVAAERGDNVFRELVRHIALALDVDHAFIGILDEADPDSDTVRVIAGYFFRRFEDGFAYDLKDTPCANVIGQRFRIYPERVTELFADPHIKQLQTEGYAGIPLYDCHGKVLGLMAIADRKPLRDLPLIEDLLKIFSVRAAVELERLYADRARNEKEQALIKSEDCLRQAQKMEAIGQLTGGIAHDFNNILTAMMGYVALAEEHTESLADEKLAKYLARIGRSGQRARDLIQQMLTFSRGQRGEPRPVALAPLIEEWVSLIASTLPSSVEIVTELDAHAAPAMVDPLHIEQVLMNLCINARDAMQGQGAVTIGLRHVRRDGVCVSCRQPVQGECLELWVSDTGCGITPEVQERMFEPFYSTKSSGHGSGMGLAMVHGIVHEYGGHVLIDSRPGEGATLRVLLPMAETQAAGDAREALPRKADRRLQGQVLLVDDEAPVSEFMQDLLESWGLSVSVFNSSVEACARFAEDPDRYDIAILDQTMPRMTGLEVAQHLLKLRPGLPVVIYTGYAEDLSEEKIREAGVRALVKKPVDTAALHELVETLLA